MSEPSFRLNKQSKQVEQRFPQGWCALFVVGQNKDKEGKPVSLKLANLPLGSPLKSGQRPATVADVHASKPDAVVLEYSPPKSGGPEGSYGEAVKPAKAAPAASPPKAS